MVLAKEKQKAVRTRRENMNYCIGGIRRHPAHVIGYLFSEGGSVLTTGDTLLTGTGRHGEGDQFSPPRAGAS